MPEIEDPNFSESEKDKALADIHAAHYVRPYDPKRDITKEELAKALGFKTSRSVPDWVRRNPGIVEAHEVHFPSGCKGKVYRMVNRNKE